MPYFIVNRFAGDAVGSADFLNGESLFDDQPLLAPITADNCRRPQAADSSRRIASPVSWLKWRGPFNLPTGPIQGLAWPFPFLDVVCAYAPRVIAVEAHRR